MRSYVVFSSMGPDRPGLAREIAEFFTARGINIERSRGCVLGNEFGMIILTSGNTDDIERFIQELDILRQKTGLDIHVRKTKAPSHREVLPSIPYKLIATSIDHPGIIPPRVIAIIRELETRTHLPGATLGAVFAPE